MYLYFYVLTASIEFPFWDLVQLNLKHTDINKVPSTCSNLHCAKKVVFFYPSWRFLGFQHTCNTLVTFGKEQFRYTVD